MLIYVFTKVTLRLSFAFKTFPHFVLFCGRFRGKTAKNQHLYGLKLCNIQPLFVVRSLSVAMAQLFRCKEEGQKLKGAPVPLFFPLRHVSHPFRLARRYECLMTSLPTFWLSWELDGSSIDISGVEGASRVEGTWSKSANIGSLLRMRKPRGLWSVGYQSEEVDQNSPLDH